MNICSRKCDDINSRVSQDSRYELEWLPSALPGTATKPLDFLACNVSQQVLGAGSPRSGCWNAPEREHPCRAAQHPPRLGSTTGAAGLLFHKWNESVGTGNTPQDRTMVSQVEQDPGQRWVAAWPVAQEPSWPWGQQEGAARPWTGLTRTKLLSVLNYPNLQVLFIFPLPTDVSRCF